ncbi:ABC transporter permease [Natrialba sp. INN-245]|uniref:ABC transporter permease n=1 Tax=Natrialba sp. INN-245 TaxID=2690967 RepID=UPI001F1A11E1|nr:ABC transporter permease [Natrialba sp. INN-245]
MTVKPTDDDAVKATDGESSSVDGSRTDGGQMFSQAEITEVTRTQRYQEWFAESIAEPFRIAWSDWRTKVGLLIIVGFLLMGLVAWISSSTWFVLERIVLVDPPIANQGSPRLQPLEDMSHPLGTDMNGRDLISGVVHATPTMIQMILAGAVFAIVVAVIVGTLAGYKGGTTETVLMTASDVAMTIPGLPLVIVLVVLIEPQSPWLIGIIITINVWAGIARTIHSQVLSLRENSYVEASRTMGIGTPTIIQKDILPNLMPYVLVNFVYASRRVIYDSVALYFLGFLSFRGVENWGVMMHLAYANASALLNPEATYMLIVPMLPIVVLSFGLMLFAQGTDRLFNPRVRTRNEGKSKTNETDEPDPMTGV